MPEPVIRYALISEEKNGKRDIIVSTTTPLLAHVVAFSILFERVSKFVRASSRSKPFGASVTGSWSKRGVSARATSIRPAEFTNVAMDARVNVGTGNVTVANAMNGILLEIEVVNSIWAIGGTAMCDGLRMKSCLGLSRLTSAPGNGREKLSGDPASLPISCRNMIT
jgi:hypothetical protein